MAGGRRGVEVGEEGLGEVEGVVKWGHLMVTQFVVSMDEPKGNLG